jgi:hypothetical protein
MIRVNFFPLQKIILPDVPAELGYGHEIIIPAIRLMLPGLPAAGRNREFEPVVELQQMLYNGGFACP